MSDLQAFRAQFPVLERLAYLNAGTEGPVPRAAAEAVHARVELETVQGRCGRPYIEGVLALAGELRGRYAGLLGCDPSEVALTGSTTDGINTVLAGLDLRPGDEVLTTDEEHPGLLAPLGRARRRFGVNVRVVPFAEIAGEVSRATRLVACSHVSWVSGRVLDARALADSGVPVLLDAAQALGAIPVDVRALGCAFYACSGQKWMCGPEGSGCLYVAADRLDALLIPWPSYASVADPEHALELNPAEGAARLDHGFPVGLRSEWALASLKVLERTGWGWIHDRALSLAARLAGQLAEAGLTVAPRGESTLVSWRSADAESDVARFAEQGLVVRYLPGLGLVRASVGAWTSEEEIERVVAAARG